MWLFPIQLQSEKENEKSCLGWFVRYSERDASLSLSSLLYVWLAAMFISRCPFCWKKNPFKTRRRKRAKTWQGTQIHRCVYHVSLTCVLVGTDDFSEVRSFAASWIPVKEGHHCLFLFCVCILRIWEKEKRHRLYPKCERELQRKERKWQAAYSPLIEPLIAFLSYCYVLISVFSSLPLSQLLSFGLLSLTISFAQWFLLLCQWMRMRKRMKKYFTSALSISYFSFSIKTGTHHDLSNDYDDDFSLIFVCSLFLFFSLESLNPSVSFSSRLPP